MKKLFAVLLILCLALTLCAPALANYDYGVIYDESELMDGDAMEQLGRTVIPEASERCGLDMRVDLLLESPDIVDIEGTAATYYDQYGYGFGDDKSGITLTVLFDEGDGDLALKSWYVYAEGSGTALLQSVRNALADCFDPELWNGELDGDRIVTATAIETFVYSVENPVQDDGQPSSGYVTDDARLLSDSERSALELRAAELSEKYGCGIYIMTVDDFTDYSDNSDIYEAAKDIYRDCGMGYGSEKSGELLLLSMAERDYSLIAYGYGNTVFTDYGKDVLTDKFLDNFADNDWNGGFTDYVEESAVMLEAAKGGSPVDVGSPGSGSDYSGSDAYYYDSGFNVAPIIISLILGCIISLVVCLILKSGMKSVRNQNEASDYLPSDSIQFKARDDHFTHRTETRVKIERESSSGGTTVDSSGFSGKSGKF